MPRVSNLLKGARIMAEDNEKEITPAENKAARSSQEEQMKKLGLQPHSERIEGTDSESDEDEDEDTEDQEEEEESEDEEEDSSEDEDETEEDSDDDEDEEDEDEEEESQSPKKKGISYKQFNELRSDLRKANKKIADLIENDSKKVETVPDDFQTRIDTLAKEIGVENPEGLKKIMSLVQEVIKGTETNFEKKLADIEEKYGKIIKNTPVEDHYSKEWREFSKSSFSKEFPNATSDELEAAQELMNRLSHTPGIGGKVYEDANGRKLLDPYELDYIYFKNKEQFQTLLTGKKSRGMEKSRTQGIEKNKGGEENKPLRKGASIAEIRDYDKRSARAMEGMDNLSTPVDDSI